MSSMSVIDEKENAREEYMSFTSMFMLNVSSMFQLSSLYVMSSLSRWKYSVLRVVDSVFKSPIACIEGQVRNNYCSISSMIHVDISFSLSN